MIEQLLVSEIKIAPRVLAISSHVVRGRVGLRAIAPVLEMAGLYVDVLPTVIMPWHPGQGPSTRTALPEFGAMMEELATRAASDGLEAVLTGYFASADQVRITADFIRGLKRDNPQLLYLCDPVIGDGDRLYVPDDVAIAIRDQLLPLADLLTPNAFELSWLSGLPVMSLEEAMVASHEVGTPGARVLASSVPEGPDSNGVPGDDGMMSLVLTVLPKTHDLPVSVSSMKHERFDNAPNGTGDLMAAAFLMLHFKRDDPDDILSATTFIMYEIVAIAHHLGAQDLPLEIALVDLLDDLLREDGLDEGLIEDFDHDDDEDGAEEPSPSVH